MSSKLQKSGFQRRTARKKETILQNAEDLLRASPGGDINMEELASKADVSKVSLYNYFGSKKGLIRTLFLEIAAREERKIRKILSTDSTFKGKTQKFLDLKLRILEAGLRKSFERFSKEDPLLQSDFSMYRKKGETWLRELFDQGRAEGALDPALTDTALFDWIEAILLYYRQNESFRNRIDDDVNFYQQITGIFWKGIAAASSES